MSCSQHTDNDGENEEIFNDLVRFEISKKMLLLGNHGGRRVRKYRRTYIDNPWETVDQFDKQRVAPYHDRYADEQAQRYKDHIVFGAARQ